MIKAFAYLRVSGPDQINGDGFPRQREAIRTYAAAGGMMIPSDGWFEEKAVPGKTEWDHRPAWVEMLLEAQRQGVTTIIIEALHRLARDLMVQEHIIADLMRRGITLISTLEPDLCSNDPTRKLMRQIMGAIAEYDRAMIVLKLRGARQRMKDDKGRCEGRKPFGFRPGEQAVLDLMLALRAEGKVIREIVETLNDAGMPARYGGRWQVGHVVRILQRHGIKKEEAAV